MRMDQTWSHHCDACFRGPIQRISIHDCFPLEAYSISALPFLPVPLVVINIQRYVLCHSLFPSVESLCPSSSSSSSSASGQLCEHIIHFTVPWQRPVGSTFRCRRPRRLTSFCSHRQANTSGIRLSNTSNPCPQSITPGPVHFLAITLVVQRLHQGSTP